MKKTSKRIIALLICVLMVLGAFPAGALAATEAEEVDELQEIMDELTEVMDADSGKTAAEETQEEPAEEEETKAAPQVAVQAESMDVPMAAPAAEIISPVLDFGSTSGLADNEWAFILVNETFEYGQDTRSIIIDTGEYTDENGVSEDHKIIGARLDASGFNVRNTVSGVDENGNAVNTSIPRTVTSVYVRESLGLGDVGDATGRYIVLELETGFDIDGASAYDGDPIDLKYSITYTINIVADGQNIFSPNERSLVQTNIVSLIVDEFEYATRVDTGLKASDGSDLENKYRYYVPENTTDPLPLVVWIHGGGESGTNNESPLRANMGATAWASPENQAVRPCYVLAPQTNNSWLEEDLQNVNEIIKEMIEDPGFNIDENRIYIVGCSRGGIGTLRYLYQFPEMVAASIPICPAHTVALTQKQADIIADANIPLWFVQSNDDQTVAPYLTRDRVETLLEAGASVVRYTEFENNPYIDKEGNPATYQGHWAWTHVANNDYVEDYDTTFMEWLFAQSKADDEADEQKFTLINETFEYGQDVIEVAIELEESVNADDVDPNAFVVTALNIDDSIAYNSRSNSRIVYSGTRNITGAYVTDDPYTRDAADSGRYIVLQLEVGFDIPGATTLSSKDETPPLNMNYAVQQVGDVGSIAAGSVIYKSAGEINLIADEFEADIIVNDIVNENGEVTGQIINHYRLYTPEKPSNNEKLPMVVWLHGGGESGTDNEIQLRANMGATAWASPENQAVRPCYVFAPQTSTRWVSDDMNNIATFIKEMIDDPDEYVDPDRIYVVGCSRGGAGTLRLVIEHTELFAAAIPICPHNGVHFDNDEYAKIAGMPLWFVNASDDRTVPATTTWGRLEQLLKEGASNLRYTEFPNNPYVDKDENDATYDGHWSWTHVANNEYVDEYNTDFMTWLFEQEKGADTRDEHGATLINETLEYGQNVIAIAIDMGTPVSASSIDEDTFIVTALNIDDSKDASTVGSGRIAYSGQRKVENAYVTTDLETRAEAASGQYIILELEYGFTVDGATTLSVSDEVPPLELHYMVQQVEQIGSGANAIAVGNAIYRHTGEINLIADEFDAGLLEGVVDTNYRLYRPEVEDDELLPLVVWLHGGGESGTDNEIQLRGNMGATAWASPENQANNPSYVLAPQSNNRWSADDMDNVAAFIQELIETENVDPDRVYAVGASRGGAGTLRLVIDHTELFAAAIPICPHNGVHFTDEEYAQIVDLPLWFVNAETDRTVPHTVTEARIETLESLGAKNIRYSLYDDVRSTYEDDIEYNGHWSWIYVAHNDTNNGYGEGFMEWLFRQNRQNLKDDEFGYYLVNETFEYGQDTIAVIIDMREEVKTSCIQTSAYNIYSNTYDALTGEATAENARRSITETYVSNTLGLGEPEDTGRYIVIELSTAYNMAGAPAFNGNGILIKDYEIQQRTNFIMTDNTVYAPGDIEFTLLDEISLIVDDFSYEMAYGDSVNTPYRLFTPEDNDEPMPLVVWTHGGGESGTNNENQLRANMGATAWASPENQAERPCYVMAPQTLSGWSMDDIDNVAAAIRQMVNDGLVDPDRIYASGCSRGGVGNLRLMAEHSDLFAAGIPICPAHDIALTEDQIESLATIPLWFVQATADNTVHPTVTRGRVESIAAAGGVVRYTEFADNPYYDAAGNQLGTYNGHWSWVHVGNNDPDPNYDETFMEWLFQQTKGAQPKNRTDYSFTLINETLEYGENTIAVAIDLGSTTVAYNAVDADDFVVTTINIDESASTSARESARVFYSGQRAVTDAYVSDTAEVGNALTGGSGRYIILELEYGFYVDGATTRPATNEVPPLVMYYNIQQVNDVGGLAAGTATFVKDGEINLIADLFGYDKIVGETGVKNEYRLFKPEVEDDELLPLVVWLHGGGESGEDNELPLRGNQGGTTWATPENQAERPCYVLVPQTHPSSRWETEDMENIAALIEELIEDENVDPDRVYAVGASRGGAGTLRLVINHTELFAAAIAICPQHTIHFTDEQYANLIDLPLWFVQAATDNTVHHTVTEGRIAQLESVGHTNVRYTLFDDVRSSYDDSIEYNGHWSWIHVANNNPDNGYDETFMDWLFAQNRQNNGVEPPVETYTIEATAGQGGSISPSGNVTVEEGASQSFRITAGNGYEIDQVLVDGSPVTLTGNTYTFTSVTDNHTIQATFKAIVTDEPIEPSDPGTEDPTDPGTDEPTDPGTEPTDPGTEPTDPGTELNVNTSTNGGGTVTVSDVNADGEVEIAIEAEEGYVLQSVLVNGVAVQVGEDGIITLTDVEEGTNIRALFVEDMEEDFASIYTDVEDDWYYDAVNALTGLGIINGVEETLFAPDANLKRSEFTKLLFELADTLGMDVEENTDIPFKDDGVDYASYWATGYIGWAFENELVYGYDDDNTEFAPEREISRQEMAVIMQRFFETYAGYDLPGDTRLNFADSDKIADWAEDAVTYVVRTGLMQGKDDGFAPEANARRSEVAQVFYNYLTA